jgi:3-hydroxyacyl-CoA dehydrogenase/enoyl-CoA hydratase/3-hydroxybutyryl-CoA epimerase
MDSLGAGHLASRLATFAEQNKHFTPCEPLIAMAEAKEAFYAEQASAS